jgi:hypothetical protein
MLSSAWFKDDDFFKMCLNMFKQLKQIEKRFDAVVGVAQWLVPLRHYANGSSTSLSMSLPSFKLIGNFQAPLNLFTTYPNHDMKKVCGN